MLLAVGDGARGEREARVPTSCLFLGWMSCDSPMSMATAMPVLSELEGFGLGFAQERPAVIGSGAGKLASWTKRKGKSPWPKALRQSVIRVEKRRLIVRRAGEGGVRSRPDTRWRRGWRTGRAGRSCRSTGRRACADGRGPGGRVGSRALLAVGFH